MKALYNAIIDKFNEVPTIAWADQDKGQIDYFQGRPAVDFPAAIIKQEITGTDRLSGNLQRCRVRVTFRVIFDFTGDTDSKAPAQQRANSLQYYNVVEAVYEAFKGFISSGHAPFNRVAQTEPPRRDGLKECVMVFETSYNV